MGVYNVAHIIYSFGNRSLGLSQSVSNDPDAREKRKEQRKNVPKNQKDTADQMSSPWIITTVVRPAGGHHTWSGRVSLRHIL